LPQGPVGAQRAPVDRARRGARADRTVAWRPIAAAAVIALLTIATLAGAVAGHADESPQRGADAPARRPDGSRLRPGDILRDHGITIIVPAAGRSVWGELKMRDGSYQELQVTTSRSGLVTVRSHGDEAAAVRAAHREAPSSEPAAVRPARPSGSRNLDAISDAGSTGSAECSDAYHRLYGWRFRHYAWRFRAISTPDYLASREGGVEAVLGALIAANENITGSHNVCGRSDQVGARFSYLGTTERGTNMSRRGTCTRGDGRSVVAFGPLPGASIAMACVYSLAGGSAEEADVRIDTATRWEIEPGSCDDALYIQPAITHEFGHVYGLGHASASSHRRLTMHPYVPDCTRFQETLGWGDMLGLRRKY
jgi:hypothetical protein